MFAMVSSLPLKSTNSLGPIVVQFGCLPTTSELNRCTVRSIVLTALLVFAFTCLCPYSLSFHFRLKGFLPFVRHFVISQWDSHAKHAGLWHLWAMGIFRFVLRLIFFQFSLKLITNLIIFQFIFTIYFNFISMLIELIFFTLINVFVHFDWY